MKVGIPVEIKPKEGRVGLIPDAAAELVKAGHEVYIQSGAGQQAGYNDESYRNVGVKVCDDAKLLYSKADLIIKVKEPIEADLHLLECRHTLFCFLHLAANIQLTRSLQQIGLTAIAFETVVEGGALPLLAPMSSIAGRVAVHAGSHYLYSATGGKGVLLGGVPGAERGRVVVLGGGVAGWNAAYTAAQMGASVQVFDLKEAALIRAEQIGNNVSALYAFQESIKQAVEGADLVVGAVLVPGAKAPTLVDEAMVKTMEAGSVLVDISVDQGGCIDTIKPTTYDHPIYKLHGVVHMGVTNLPGAVPRTASQTLSGAILPYALHLANHGWQNHPGLLAGINVRDGNIELDVLKV
ncbi:MAG: alanine dehydrogenase [Pseudomonadales bacterium]|nr:alanine dehydrogenase [Pseudomonadales bacterium]